MGNFLQQSPNGPKLKSLQDPDNNFDKEHQTYLTHFHSNLQQNDLFSYSLKESKRFKKAPFQHFTIPSNLAITMQWNLCKSFEPVLFSSLLSKLFLWIQNSLDQALTIQKSS